MLHVYKKYIFLITDTVSEARICPIKRDTVNFRVCEYFLRGNSLTIGWQTNKPYSCLVKSLKFNNLLPAIESLQASPEYIQSADKIING